MSDASPPVISLQGVTRRFRSTVAVDGVSLQVQRGQVLGLLGPNGAGKSTLIKMLMGLVWPDAGELRVLDVVVTRDPNRVRQRVGYVPEQHFIYRWMSVQGVLAFCRPFYPTWNDVRARELVKQFGLDPGKRVQHLSKGMVTKLALVIALAHEPEALILDEPMAGLDALVREELVEGVLQDLCRGDRTMLLSSHTFSDVHRLADVIAIMHEGRILVQMPTAELLSGTKRVRAVLKDGVQPAFRVDGTVCDRVQGREWLVTLRDFEPAKLERLRAMNAIEQLEVVDLGLEEIFKDYIRGARSCGQEVLACHNS